jgi:cinnamyl-alcohol dehydrogenase
LKPAFNDALKPCIYIYIDYLHARHEIAGIVKEVGTNVDRFKAGDHVGVGTYVNTCRDCEFCNKELEVHCAKGAVLTFNSIDVDGTITKGGFSDYIVVHERQVFYNVQDCRE